jgi:penicillin-binding protein 1A
VPISSIPRSLIEAFIAAEDKNFFNHPGVDVVSIIRAAVYNISKVLHNRRMEGGSTITQQVVKNFLLTNERSLERKIKEAILSYMVSKTFTKEQILELYLNQTFLGRRAYGVAAAAQNYFNKSVDELNLAESALIAALPKAPASYDPEKNYEKSKERRDYVLIRMFEDGYITEEAAREAIQLPIIIEKRDRSETVSAGYYAEQVREEVIKMFGKEYFYTGGLTVITSLDAKMQEAAQNALRKCIREYDRKRGFRRSIANIDITNWQESLKKIAVPTSLLEYKLAVVLALSDLQAKIGLSDGSTSKITLSEMKWGKTALKSAKSLLKVGDVIAVEPLKIGYALRQIPEVNGAMMVMDSTSGQALAIQGGYDFTANKFDGVSQAFRQPGSLIKTFVYLAALENGIQPNRIFEDDRIAISQGPGMPMWRPKNYKGDFLGPITMRRGLEKSRNLITVRVAQSIGLGKVAEIIKRFSINSEPKLFYSMVLGSLETTLEKMTTAYAVIANSGRKLTPHYVELIKDRNGKVIYRRDNRQCQSCIVPDFQLDSDTPPELPELEARMVTDEASDYQITSMLTGAAQRGTAAATNKLGKIMACKTGTTNDSKDTWLVCFTPRIVVGTRIGYDIPKDMGKNAMGANVPMPALIDFMENAYKDIPSIPFKVPDSIKLVPVDPNTGKLVTGVNTIMEAFKVNDIPAANEESGQGDDSDIFHHLPVRDESQEIY